MRNYFRIFYLVFFIFIFTIGCNQTQRGPVYEIHKSASGTKGMVVSAHPLASQVGLEILKEGGNAADAAIAVQFALAVVYPRAGNLGGGGFLTYRNQDGVVVTLDFRERAPLGAFRDMYLDSSGQVKEGSSREGILSAGIPGTVAGLVEMHKTLGSVPSW